MANNKTEVAGGVLQPRYYQVYGDLIESKEVMEPISIVAGTGPICGFDWVDTSNPEVTITSVLKKVKDANPGNILELAARSKRVFISDTDNRAGQVYNAYSTPDGLIHVAPEILTFTGQIPEGGWPDLNHPSRLVAFVLKGKHTYRPENSENAVPMSNFSISFISLRDGSGETDISISYLVEYTTDQWIALIKNNSGVVYDENIETILGIYLVGWSPNWNSANDMEIKNVMRRYNYTLCLNPYEGQLPGKSLFTTPFDIPVLKNKVSGLSLLPNRLTKVEELASNLIQSSGTGFEIEATIAAGEVDDDVVTFTKLIINGVDFVPNPPVSKNIHYQWSEGADAMCILFKLGGMPKPGDVVRPEDWGIGSVILSYSSTGALQILDSDIISGYTDPSYKLVGIFFPNTLDSNNSGVIINSGTYVPDKSHIDKDLPWRLLKSFKDTFWTLRNPSTLYSLQTLPGNANDFTIVVQEGVSSVTLYFRIRLNNVPNVSQFQYIFGIGQFLESSGKQNLFNDIKRALLLFKPTSSDQQNFILQNAASIKNSDYLMGLSTQHIATFNNVRSWLEFGTNSTPSDSQDTEYLTFRFRVESITPATQQVNNAFLSLNYSMTFQITNKLDEIFNKTFMGNK